MDSKIKHHKRKLNAKGKRKRRKRLIKRILRLLIILIPLILLCTLISCTSKHLRDKDKDNVKNNDKDTVLEVSTIQPSTATLIASGDIIMHGPFLNSSHYHQEDGSYNYDSLFTYVKDTYTSADFAIVNLENTISVDNYTSYPMFRGPEAMATALSENGIDMCLLANNHIYDNFADGLTMTQDAMNNNNLLYTGIKRTADDDIYEIVNVNGIKIGFLNYTYETAKDGSGNRTINSIPVKEDNISLINTFNYNELDSFYTEITESLNAMESQGVEYTIAFLHWGNEYQTTENEQQREIAQKLCDIGIDALIGGHPHVIQPVDLLTSTSGEHQMVCAYSIGNHITNQHEGRISQSPNGHTEDGLMVSLTLDRDKDGHTVLSDVEFIPTWTYRTVGVSDASNPEYFVFPLNDVDSIVSKAKEISNLDIQTQVNRSLERTNAIIGEGVSKIEQNFSKDKESTE